MKRLALWAVLSVLCWGALAFAWSALSGCSVYVPGPAPDPHVAPVESSECAAAGARLEELHCFSKSGAPLWRTPEGSPFSEACERAAADGRDWHAALIARIEDCSQLEAAYRGEP